jgi:hypothetical protein
MATTIAGTFAERANAQRAIEGLRGAGVPASDISMIVRDEESAQTSEHQDAGVPEEYAATYMNHVESGHVLLTVRTGAVPPRQVREIMVHSGALNIYPGTTTLV